MATNVVKQIRRNTRRKFSADEKIRIVVESLRGEISISELCRREGIQPSLFYRWSKQFLEAGKNGLTRETKRDASDDEVRELKSENEQLKISLAEAHLAVLRYKKASARKRPVQADASRNETGGARRGGAFTVFGAQDPA